MCEKQSPDQVLQEVLSTADESEMRYASDIADYLANKLPEQIKDGSISIEDALFEMFSLGTNYGGCM